MVCDLKKKKKKGAEREEAGSVSWVRSGQRCVNGLVVSAFVNKSNAASPEATNKSFRSAQKKSEKQQTTTSSVLLRARACNDLLVTT